MISLLKLAFRNCLRNKRRSFLTFLAITIGILVLLVSTTLINGIDYTTIRSFKKTSVSPVKIYNEKYFKDRNDVPLENLIENPDETINLLKSVNTDMTVVKRIKFRGRIIKDANELITNIIGIDAVNDGKIFELVSSIKDQNVLKQFYSEPNTCLLGDGLLKALELNPGDEIEVYCRTKNDAHNAISFKIAGSIYTENPEIDSFTTIMKIEDAVILSDVGDSVTEIDINHITEDKLSETVKLINKSLPAGLKAYSWEEQLSDILSFFKLRKLGLTIIIVLLLILAIVGVTNTMLMAVFERTKEIGTLQALGMKSNKIVILFIFEGLVLGLAGGCAALIMSAIPIKLFCSYGFTIMNSNEMQNMASKIYGQIDWFYFPLSIIVAMLTAAIASLYPSLKAVSLNVAQVLRGK